MSKTPRYSPGYLRAVREDRDDWIKTRVRNQDEAKRKEREAEIAAVMAELEKNKPA